MKCQGWKKNGDPCKYEASNGITCKSHTHLIREIQSKEVPQMQTTPEVKPSDRIKKMNEFFKAHPVDTIKFCCVYHKKIVEDILSREFVSLKQVDYMAGIVAGKANHRNQADPNKVFTIKCASFGCECKITGTAIELGVRKNLCDEHGNS